MQTADPVTGVILEISGDDDVETDGFIAIFAVIPGNAGGPLDMMDENKVEEVVVGEGQGMGERIEGVAVTVVSDDVILGVEKLLTAGVGGRDTKGIEGITGLLFIMGVMDTEDDKTKLLLVFPRLTSDLG